MTAPYSPAVAQLVTGPHRTTFSATVVDAIGSIPLDVLDGSSIDWTERRAPCVSARLVCAIPDSATLDRIDARKALRLKVRAGYYLPDGTLDEQQIADLHVRVREVSRPDSVMTLTAASDEFLLIDGAPRAQPMRSPFIPATLGAGITSLIRDLVAGTPAQNPLIVDHSGGLTGQTVIGTDYWRAITDLADIGDLDVYDQGDRVFRIQPRRNVAGDAAAVLATGPGGVITASSSVGDRDDWANGVSLYYEWRNATTNATEFVVGSSCVAGGPFAPSVVGYKEHAEQREGPITQAAADAAARALLRRFLSRTRTVQLTAPAMWWLRPRQTVTVQLPTGTQERHLVVGVTFDIAAHSMTVLTRRPDTDSILYGE